MNYLNARSPQVRALQGGATLVLVPAKTAPHCRLCVPPGAPYRIGQRVGVREVFEVLLKNNAFTDPDEYGYFADDPYPKGQGWQPPSKMPERAIRLWFEVSAVRVIKVSEISEEDALKCIGRVDPVNGVNVRGIYAVSYLAGMWHAQFDPRHPWDTSWAFGFEGVVTK